MMRNLPWAASKDEVTNAVKALVSFEKLDLPVNLDGRNRGFGFVTFATEADKDKATATLAALEIGGRKVSVHEYVETPRGERPPRTGGFQDRRPRFDSEGRPPRNFRGPQGGEGGNPSS